MDNLILDLTDAISDATQVEYSDVRQAGISRFRALATPAAIMGLIQSVDLVDFLAVGATLPDRSSRSLNDLVVGLTKAAATAGTVDPVRTPGQPANDFERLCTPQSILLLIRSIKTIRLGAAPAYSYAA